MSTGASGSAEEVFYKELKYRTVSPLEHELQCLDVFVKSEQSLLRRIKSKTFGNMRPLVRLGSMFSDLLMAENSKWRSVDANLGPLRVGLADLGNFMINRPSHKNFQKKKLPRFTMSFSSSKGGVLWLAGVAGIEMERGESLLCTMDGLTAASVDFLTIFNWIKDGDWRPDMSSLQRISSDWSNVDSSSKRKKLWIVTEVLYATKLTVAGRKGVFERIMAQAPGVSVPGLALDTGADVGVRLVKETTLELKAKRNEHFIVGYRTMRVEYNPDGTMVQIRKAEDTGLRGDEDDPHQLNLVLMEEDIFEVDEDEGKVSIPLLTPTEKELDVLRSFVANSGDAESSAST